MRGCGRYHNHWIIVKQVGRAALYGVARLSVFMKTVRILGAARNAREFTEPVPPGVEVWLSNNPTTTLLRCKKAINYWTRWFNLHSKAWILGVYPSAWHYYGNKALGRPVYLLKAQEDIPTSIAFPRGAIQTYFATAKGPNRYFTCSVAWLLAFAIMEGFERIELWGFELRDKPTGAYMWERPCVAYWMQVARDAGIDVWYQPEIERLYEAGKMMPGNPDTYNDKLYGYSTKPEPDWCLVHEEFGCCQA